MKSAHADSPKSLEDTTVVIPNFNPRFSGVTASIISVLPPLMNFQEVRTIGGGLPDSFPKISWWQLLKIGCRGSWRIWHASRNIEMLAGLLLKKIFRL